MPNLTARNVRGSTWGADSLATMNPVAHITTNDAEAAAIQLGVGLSRAMASRRSLQGVGRCFARSFGVWRVRLEKGRYVRSAEAS